MLGKVLAIALLGLVALASLGCDGKTVVRSGDEAARYVDELLRGKSPDGFALADDASPVARAAFADEVEVSALRRTFDEFPEQSCDVVGLVSSVAEPAPEFPYPLTLTSAEQDSIWFSAEQAGVPTELTDQVLDAAVDMAQSTWVDAADEICDVATSF